MPKADSVFLLGQITASDGTGLNTVGVNFVAPMPCDIVSVNNMNRTNTTTDVLTIFVYPVSQAAGTIVATVVASAMFTLGSGDFGSYGAGTLRQFTDPTSASSVGRHLNKDDQINVAWTSGGTIANVKGISVQIWAQLKR